MAIAVLLLVVVAGLLVVLKIVSLPIAIALAVAGLFLLVAIGDRRDRPRHRGVHAPSRHLDPDRSVLPTSAEPMPEGFTHQQTDVGVATQPRSTR